MSQEKHFFLFCRIGDANTPEERMQEVVKWYLTSIHVGRNGSVAKKPYNPIIGEVFHCSWKVPRDNCPSLVCIIPTSRSLLCLNVAD